MDRARSNAKLEQRRTQIHSSPGSPRLAGSQETGHARPADQTRAANHKPPTASRMEILDGTTQ